MKSPDDLVVIFARHRFVRVYTSRLMSKPKREDVRWHCSIYEWVEDADPDFAGVMRKLCVVGALSSRRHGTTFFYPSDETRKEIQKLSSSSKQDDVVAAVKMIRSHIVHIALPDGEAFRKNKVANLEGGDVKVDTASAKTVTLDDGTVLELADDFRGPLVVHPAGPRKIFVWRVVSGKIKGAVGAGVPRRRRDVRGAAEDAPPQPSSARLHLTNRIQGQYIAALSAGQLAGNDPFMAHLASLLLYLQQAHPATYATVMPTLDRRAPVSWFLLVEPYRCHNQVISDAMIADWGGAPVESGAAATVANCFDTIGELNAQYPCVAFGDPRNFAAALDNTRLALIGEAGGCDQADASLPGKVTAAYESLVSTNSLEGLSPMFPAATAAFLGGGRMFWGDQFRFNVGLLFKDINSGHSEITPQDVFLKIATSFPGNNYMAETAAAYGDFGGIDPSHAYAVLCRFVNSTDLFYTARSASEVGNWGDAPIASGIATQQAFSEGVVNLERGKQHELLIHIKNEPMLRLSASCVVHVKHVARQMGVDPASLLA